MTSPDRSSASAACARGGGRLLKKWFHRLSDHTAHRPAECAKCTTGFICRGCSRHRSLRGAGDLACLRVIFLTTASSSPLWSACRHCGECWGPERSLHVVPDLDAWHGLLVYAKRGIRSYHTYLKHLFARSLRPMGSPSIYHSLRHPG